ncbi:MAG: hypothetical protein HY812_13100 [Planctomycetes bacterium]|nr:hypothetical protein [Planctomycetota bacterium]
MWTAGILLSFLLAPQQPAADASWLSASARGGQHVLLAARIDFPKSLAFTPGLKARQVCVVLRNDGEDSAVALRAIAWAGLPGEVNWHVRIGGATREDKGRTVVYDPMVQSLTDLAFERGLLLPGEELRVPLPLNVQPRPAHELRVSYAVVGDEIRLWRDMVLLPVGEDPLLQVFAPASAESLARRMGEGGGLALVRSTMKEGWLVLEGEVGFTVALPRAPAGEAEETGGLSADDAWRRAGLAPGEDALIYYEPLLRAWFLIRCANGRAVALAKKEGEWEPVSLNGRWDAAAPAGFNSAGDGGTNALLDAEAFGDLAEVNLPSTGLYYDPGATRLEPDALWEVLRRASERALDVRLVAIDANGFGVERLLAIGVDVDARGRRRAEK